MNEHKSGDHCGVVGRGDGLGVPWENFNSMCMYTSRGVGERRLSNSGKVQFNHVQVCAPKIWEKVADPCSSILKYYCYAPYILQTIQRTAFQKVNRSSASISVMQAPMRHPHCSIQYRPCIPENQEAEASLSFSAHFH